jgi:hypothetical protein
MDVAGLEPATLRGITPTTVPSVHCQHAKYYRGNNFHAAAGV